MLVIKPIIKETNNMIPDIAVAYWRRDERLYDLVPYLISLLGIFAVDLSDDE